MLLLLSYVKEKGVHFTRTKKEDEDIAERIVGGVRAERVVKPKHAPLERSASHDHPTRRRPKRS